MVKKIHQAKNFVLYVFTSTYLNHILLDGATWEHDLGLDPNFVFDLVFDSSKLCYDLMILFFDFSKKRKAEVAQIREKYPDIIPVRAHCLSFTLFRYTYP